MKNKDNQRRSEKREKDEKYYMRGCESKNCANITGLYNGERGEALLWAWHACEVKKCPERLEFLLPGTAREEKVEPDELLLGVLHD
jgi:hypothetical protein